MNAAPEDDAAAERRALENQPCALLSFSDDGTIRHANARLHRWLGLTPGALPGRPVNDLLTPASRVFHSTHFFPLLKLHGRADEIHLVLRDAAGADLPVLASAVRESDGGAPLNHCALMAMGRRKEFEQTLLDARKAAEAATAAKDEFLAVVSHELRTPLAAIAGWVRLARSGRLEPAQQSHALETIERNAQLQTQLVDDLLDVSRIVSGNMRISARPVELAAAVEAAIDACRPAAQARAIALSTSVDAAAGIVHADPSRVQQIVWNLVANAVKFTPQGGRVDVRLAGDGATVRLTVSDSGAGIDPAQLPYVFDRFWQATSTGAPRENLGLGLGLAICRSLVELHGGSIAAESGGVGQGAVFTVELPIATTTAPA